MLALVVGDDLGQAAGEEEVDDLVVAARRRVHRHQVLPPLGDEVDLFGQLALRRLERRLPRDIEETGRDLPVALLDRLPVLLDEHHPAVVVQGDDRRGAGVLDVLPGHLPVAVLHGVGAEVPHGPLEDEVAGDDLQVDGLVAQRLHVSPPRRRTARSNGDARAPRRPVRGRAGAARWGATAARGGPAWRCSTGGHRAAARRTRRGRGRG